MDEVTSLFLIICATASPFVGLWVYGLVQDHRRASMLMNLGFARVGPMHLSQTIGGVPVLLEEHGHDFRLIVGWPPPSGLTLVKGRSTRPLGDPDFDREVTPTGTRAAALAHLTADARRALTTAIRNGWSLGTMGLERRIGPVAVDTLMTTITDAHAVAMMMPRRRRTLVEGLLERLATDPLADVRYFALEELLGLDTTDDDDIAAALQQARRDSDPRIRMIAARGLDEPALFTNIALTNGAPSHLRAEAFMALVVRHASHPATSDLMQRVTRCVQGEAQPGLSRPAVVAMVAALGPMLQQDALQELVRKALEGEDDLALAAIDALELGGGLWAVPYLAPLRDRRSSSKVGAAAKRLISILQARHGGELGALALASDGGELALSDG